MVVARFSAAGVYEASAVCYAPHLIDYAARAVAVKPNGSIVLVGYGRDRHASAAVPPTGPSVQYGLRAVVTLPPSGNSTTACGTYSANGTLSLGSSGVGLDGVNPDGTGADPALGGRVYDAVVALPDNRYVVATSSGPDGTSWVQRYSATGVGTLDGGFNGGRVSLGATSLHALALLGDGSVLAAGESTDPASSAARQMLVAKITTSGAMGAFGTGGIARTLVAGGTDSGQAIAVQSDGNILVGGQANLAGKSAFALTRFTAGGVARRHVRQPRSDSHAARHSGGQRLHHRHRALGQHARRGGPADRRQRPGRGGRALLRDRRSASPAPAPRRVHAQGRQHDGHERARHGLRQRQWHRQPLLARVRHRPPTGRRPTRWRPPGRATSMSASRSRG